MTTYLEVDRRPDRYRAGEDGKLQLPVRRHEDCQRLRVCELEWTELHSVKQAKCPEPCPHFMKKDV